MLHIHHFPLVALAALLLNLTPGADIFYVLGRTVAQGRRVGLLARLTSPHDLTPENPSQISLDTP